jgi:hypothetical protein
MLGHVEGLGHGGEGKEQGDTPYCFGSLLVKTLTNIDHVDRTRQTLQPRHHDSFNNNTGSWPIA